MDAIAPEALLFQSGYLTILNAEDAGGELLYRLGHPNREGAVQQRDAARVAIAALAHRLERTVPDIARVIDRRLPAPHDNLAIADLVSEIAR